MLTAITLRITQFLPHTALLRRYPRPQSKKLAEFREFCARFAPDVSVDVPSSIALGSTEERLTAAAVARYGPEYADFVRLMVVRTMTAAEYFSATDIPDAEDWLHYGLGFTHYTHFTSPIRCYPDLIVHRQLQATLDMEAAHVGPAERVLSVAVVVTVRRRKRT